MACITVSGSVVGSESNLVITGKNSYAWGDCQETGDVWRYGRKLLKNGYDARVPAALAGVTFLASLPESYRMMAACLGIPDPAPWRWLLPEHAYAHALDAFVGTLWDAVETYGRYYRETYAPSQGCLDSLQPAVIDKGKLDRAKLGEAGLSQRTALDSFMPTDGKVGPPLYDRLKSVTGRLRIVGGPMVLTLAKRHRGIITSRFPGGKILQLDFVSLEPRVAMAMAGKDASGDIHSRLGQEVLGGMERSVAKFFVNAVIHGAGIQLLSVRSGLRPKLVEHYLTTLKTYLNAKSGSKSVYGRPINVEGAVPYGHVVQSTAVDVALLGFSEIVKELEEQGIVPLYVVHDALVIDVPRPLVAMVQKERIISVSGFECSFPLTASAFM